MYHSITFADPNDSIDEVNKKPYGVHCKNTYTDWHLVPETRPVINPPEQKTYTVDIPGGNGVIDLSTSLSGYPVFNNRTGELNFHVLNDIEDWSVIYANICKYLNGRLMKMILDDIPDYYFIGRITAYKWKSPSDGTWSGVTLKYDVEPYSLSTKISNDSNWLWNPFSFVDGVIQSALFKGITVNSTSTIKWIEIKDGVGEKPIVPTIILESGNSIDVYLTNTDFNINERTHQATRDANNNGRNVFHDFIIGNLTEWNTMKIGFKGTGTVSLEFRKGRI